MNTSTTAASERAPVTVAEVMRCVARGTRRIRGQREALRGALSCPDLTGVRSDFRGHLEGWWRVHVGYASWGGPGRSPRGTTEPTRAKVCHELGHADTETGEWIPLSVSTYKRCSRWWRARGYAAIVRPGWTPALRPMALVRDDDHNERQVLVLCLPHPKKAPAPPAGTATPLSGPLSGPRSGPGTAPSAREPANSDKPREDRAPRGLSLLPPEGPGPLAAVPQSGSEALTAARAMQDRAAPLRQLSDRHLRHLARPFWAAGWRPADILHALDHEPGGRPHGYTAAVRAPAAWIRSRLAEWTGPDGTPLPSAGQVRAAAAAADRAALAARRRELADVAARKSPDYAGHAARARAMLGLGPGAPRPQPG